MTSLFHREHGENFFLLDEQPPANLHSSESFDGIKSIQHLLSTSSSGTLPNQQPYRSLTPVRSSSSRSNDIESFTRQFEKRLDEHRVQWQNDYDRKIQRMIESKTHELEGLKVRYEAKLLEAQETNRQLEILSGQINEENKRLKIELEHEKQQNKIEQSHAHHHYQEFEKDMTRKMNELKVSHENDKQESRKQHSKIYQDLFDETNQRLKKMENDYKNQQSTNQVIVEEMEKRMVDLCSNVEHLQQVKQKIDEDKIQLIKSNEQLQLQVQELTNRQRYTDRNHTDKTQRSDNELKSVRLRYESSVDLLRKENEILKAKSTKTIDDLEGKFSLIAEKFHEIQNCFERKLLDQQRSSYENIKQCENENEKKMQLLKQEHKNQSYRAIQQKDQMKSDFDQQIEQLTEKTREDELRLKLHYQQNEDKLIEEMKQQYEEMLSKKDEKMKNDFEQINQLSLESKRLHETEKQQLIHEYEQFIRKLEKQCSQKIHEYEKRIEMLISKTHVQLKAMEDEFEARHCKQQAVITDQQKLIQSLKDEQTKVHISHDKQYAVLSEQSAREKNEIKAQFDSCMKNLEKNFQTLTLKKEQLERKLSYLTDHHKHQIIECRLSYENNLKGLVSNETRRDLENTIHSLKQQVVYLQQRVAFLQQEQEQYIQVYGHRLLSQ